MGRNTTKQRFKLTRNRKNISRIQKPSRKPKLIINMKSELKIRAAMDIMGSYEVSSLGVIVETREKDTFKLIDIMFTPQINIPTFVETDDEIYFKWYIDIFIITNNKKLVRLDVHIHINFIVSHS